MRRVDAFSSVFVALLSGFLWWSLNGVPPEVAYYPKAVLLGLLACSFTLFIKNILPGKAEHSVSEAVKESRRSRSIVWLIVLSTLYLVALPYSGFIVTSAAFLSLTMWRLGIQKWTMIVGVAAATILFVYLGFEKGLMVPLPDGYAIWALLG
jgi:hypothetical protein